MPSPDGYVPGVCNIGPAEVKKRAWSGWVGLAATLLLAALLYGGHHAPAWRLLLFFPAFSAACGYWQARLHFCLGFGFKAVFNFGEPGRMDTVMEAEFRRLDRAQAQRILLYSALTAAPVAVAAVFIG